MRCTLGYLLGDQYEEIWFDALPLNHSHSPPILWVSLTAIPANPGYFPHISRVVNDKSLVNRVEFYTGKVLEDEATILKQLGK
jgi:hypothetical protein